MKLLKAVVTVIGFPLAHILNLSLQQRIFPNALKQSKIILIFKGDTDQCDNCRQIALLKSTSKLLEKIIINNHLSNHLQLNNLLNKFQFGFQKN